MWGVEIPSSGPERRHRLDSTPISGPTILSLLKTVGDKCARLFDAKIQNMRPRFVQADEA